MSRGIKQCGQRVVVYGAPGIGKTTLCAMAPAAVVIDLDRGANSVDCARVEGVATWKELRGVIASIPDEFRTLVIDSGSAAERLATAHVLATVPHEKGGMVSRIEEYGFGKGYRFIYDEFIDLLGDLDRQVDSGRNVIIVCHQITSVAPNPEGEDYLRYEPDLQQPPKTGRTRDTVLGWCDHMFFVSLDTAVMARRGDTEGKAKGGGTRTIYTQMMPTYWAKSRTLDGTMRFDRGSVELWDRLFGRNV